MTSRMLLSSPDAAAGGDPAFPTSADFNEVDEMVLEYLLFRGFTRSFRAVAADCKADRIRCFEADMVVGELLDLITTHDLRGFHSLWSFLDARFFSHLDSNHRSTVSDLRTRLDRLFLVHALRSDRKDVVHVFFQTFGADLHRRSAAAARQKALIASSPAAAPPSAHSSGSERSGGESGGGVGGLEGLSATTHSEWSEWFALPYAADPASDPAFKVYFTPQWVASLKLSLLNFLSLVFRATPLPKLLLLEKWHKGSHQSKLRSSLKQQQQQGDALAQRVRSLEAQVTLLLGVASDLAAHTHRSSIDHARRRKNGPRVSTKHQHQHQHQPDAAMPQEGRGLQGHPSQADGGPHGGGDEEADDDGSGGGGGCVSLFDEDDHAKARLEKMRGEGGRVLSLAALATETHATTLVSSQPPPPPPPSSLSGGPTNAAAWAGGAGGSAADSRHVEELGGAVKQWLQTLQAGTAAAAAGLTPSD